MTVSPKRRRTKRQSESSSNSSGSDSSDTDSDNARSITIGGRRLRRTAARTAQQANRSQQDDNSVPPPRKRKQAKAQSKTTTSDVATVTTAQVHHNNNTPRVEAVNPEDYFTSDSSTAVDTEMTPTLTASTATTPPRAPPVLVTPPRTQNTDTPPTESPSSSSTDSGQSEGSLDLIRITPIIPSEQVDRRIAQPVNKVPTATLGDAVPDASRIKSDAYQPLYPSVAEMQYPIPMTIEEQETLLRLRQHPEVRAQMNELNKKMDSGANAKLRGDNSTSNSAIKVNQLESKGIDHTTTRSNQVPTAPSPDRDLYEGPIGPLNIQPVFIPALNDEIDDSPERMTVSPMSHSSSSSMDTNHSEDNNNNQGQLKNMEVDPHRHMTYTPGHINMFAHTQVTQPNTSLKTAKERTNPFYQVDQELIPAQAAPLYYEEMLRVYGDNPLGVRPLHTSNLQPQEPAQAEKRPLIQQPHHHKPSTTTPDTSQLPGPSQTCKNKKINPFSQEFSHTIMEDDSKSDDKFLKYIDPIKKWMSQMLDGKTAKTRNTRNIGAAGDPYDSPSSSSSSADDKDIERRSKKKVTPRKSHKDASKQGKKRPKPEKEKDGSKDQNRAQKRKKGTKGRGKTTAQGGDDGDSSPDSGSSDDSEPEDDDSEDDNSDHSKKSRKGGKNKSSSSGTTVQVVGMHGKVPDLAKYYNSFQDEITFTELIEEFEIQAYGLGIARTQWARLLATYLKHSALIEYQNVIKEHPKYADNYEKLKEALMGKFGTRGGQHKSSELFTKTKGTDTVGKFYTTITSLAKQTFPDIDEKAQEKIIKSQFIRGLDWQTRRAVLNEDNLSLREVFIMAERFESTNAMMDNHDDKMLQIHAGTTADREQDRILLSLVKQVEELKNTAESRRQRNFNQRFGDQKWREERPSIDPTAMYRIQPYQGSNEVRFDRFGNPWRNHYHTPLIDTRCRNQYQYGREKSLERTQIENYHHNWQTAPRERCWGETTIVITNTLNPQKYITLITPGSYLQTK